RITWADSAKFLDWPDLVRRLPLSDGIQRSAGSRNVCVSQPPAGVAGDRAEGAASLPPTEDLSRAATLRKWLTFTKRQFIDVSKLVNRLGTDVSHGAEKLRRKFPFHYQVP